MMTGSIPTGRNCRRVVSSTAVYWLIQKSDVVMFCRRLAMLRTLRMMVGSLKG